MAFAAAAALACPACAGASPAANGDSIVALGDSVPYGTNCHCTPYPELTAKPLQATAANDAVPGYRTTNVRRQILSDTAVVDRLRGADVVEIEVGANDVAYSSQCGTSVGCYTPRLPAMERNLAAIVRRVRRLTNGHKRVIVLLDYWSVWLGGKYATEKGQAYVNAASELTARVDAAIKTVAADSGSAYVDLRAAFKGPTYLYDETHYLSSDGDHPNAAGHEQIAKATVTVVESQLKPKSG